MKENNTVPTMQLVDLFDAVAGFFSYVKTKIKWLIYILLILISFSIVYYYFLQKPKYEASTTFILEEKSSSMGGGLSGLASQIGVDLGGLTGSSGLFAGDNILDIIRSRSIIEKVLLSKVDSTQNLNSETLMDLYIRWNQLHQKWVNKGELANINYLTHNNKNSTRLQDSVLFVVYEKINKNNLVVERANKKGSIFEVKTIAGNEVFAKLFTERLVLETIKMYLDIKTGTATRNIQRLENRADSLMNLLNSKSFRSATLQVLDANIAYKTSTVPVEVSQREKTVTYALYTEVVKNLEASRMALAGQTPVINLLDNAKYPLEDKRFSLSLLLAMSTIFSAIVFFAILFVTFPSKEVK
jgi:hypothetical protein